MSDIEKKDDNWIPQSYPIPTHWVYTELETVFENLPLTGKKLAQKDYDTAGKIPVIDQGVSEIGGYSNYQEKVVTPERPVIIFGDHTKCLKYIPYPFIPGADGIKVLLPSLGVDPKFAFYACTSLRLPDRGYSRHFSFLKKCDFPLPPLNEQKRIVAKIEELFSELDNGITALKIAREQLKVYRQSVLKHAFEGKLTAKWREDNADKLESPEQLLARIQQEREARYQEQLEDWETAVKEWEINGKKGKKPSKPRKQKIKPIGKSDFDDLFDIPEKWKWVFLNELSEYIVDGTHHTPDYTDSGVPFISAKDIRDFKINFEKARFISDLQHKDLIKRCRPRKNSVLLTKSGTIGRVALVDIDFEFSLFESVSNIPILGNLQGRFVMWAVYFQVSTYFGAKNQKGVAVRHLHLEDIRRLPVPLPSYNEQTVFVEKIENIFNRISENEAVIDAELLRAETLRQSILKKAFSGQLVPQDPSDEPASKLLARIQAEKEFVNTQKTSKSNKRHSVSGH